MMRALQRPSTAHPAALEYLQCQAVILVRGALVGREQPPAVGRHVRDGLPRQALEVLAHHRDALGRTVGLFVMDRANLRVDLSRTCRRHPRRLRPAVHCAAFAGVGRRHAVAAIPSAAAHDYEVPLEQVAQERGAGAEHADHHHGRVDALLGDRGVPLRPVDDPQPVHEAADDVRRIAVSPSSFSCASAPTDTQ